MRILFITTQLPFPPKSGGLIKTFRLLQHLTQGHEVSLLHLMKGEDSDHLEAFKSSIELKEHLYMPIDRPRTPLNLLKSYVFAPTLNVYRNMSTELEQSVSSRADQADVIIIDHYEMGQYVPSECRAKVVLHEHNAEYVMWDRLADLERNPIKKAVLRIEAARIRKTEKRYALRADQVWAAPNDINELEEIGVPRTKMRQTFHLGEDEMLENSDIQWEDTRLSLLFVATLTWEANVHGLLWFMNECWSDLKDMHPDLTVDVIGKNPDQRLLQAAEGKPGIQFLGFVDDLAPHYAANRVFLVPLRFGSGIKVKLLNAMYRGIPTVTTSIGMEGLEVENGKELFIADDSKSYTESVSRLLTDRQCWEAQRNHMRIKAKQYSWSHLLAQHETQLRELLE